MEYTFRNTPKEKEIKLRLDTNSIGISLDNVFRSIPYKEITEIRLNRNGGAYFMSISALNKDPLRISNFSHDQQGERIDQSRAYLTFVRVLHVHLYGKDKACFRTGTLKGKIVLCSAGLVGLVAFAFFSAYYFNQLRMVPLYIVGSLIIPVFWLLHELRPSQWPKSYDPSSLPIHLLPPAA